MPSVHSDLIARTQKDKARRAKLNRCQKDLWFLAADVLGYRWNPKAGRYGKGLTEEFHRPICDWRQANRDKSFLGFWMGRWHHKTTIVIAEMIQDWLIDPSTCLLYWHAVDDRASEVVTELVGHLKTNKELRSLDPVGEYKAGDMACLQDPSLIGQTYKIFPSPQAKRFQNTTGFTLCKTSITDGIDRRANPSRFQSLLARGAGSETTGAHGNKAYLDDVIGRNDIEDGQLPKKASWYQNTVLPVVDDMVIRASGTPWGDWGMYADWKESPDWHTLFIPGSTADAYVNDELNLRDAVDWSKKKIDLTPDYKLEHPVYGLKTDRAKMKKRLSVLQRQMKSDFAPQIMVDESPEGERPWVKSECEHFIDKNELRQLHGQYFILSDPAPAGPGASDETKQKQRGDGSKDDWATCVVKIGVRGERQDIILVTGKASTEWGPDEGLDVICDFIRQFPSPRVYIEGYGFSNKMWDFDMRRAARRNNVKYRPVKFSGSRVLGAKNIRFKKLADRAKDDEFMIYEGCDKAFLEKFLEQARQWRPLPKGRNSLRFDDCADVVAMAVNTEIMDLAPKVDYTPDPTSPYKPLEPAEPETSWGTRYIRV